MALKGTISGGKSLGGKISAAEVPEEYEGSYEVTPKAFSGQVLITAGKKMKKTSRSMLSRIMRHQIPLKGRRSISQAIPKVTHKIYHMPRNGGKGM
ncbi:MAG: hypothetical protein LUE23_04450 [Lachnospiraceae bacterium]|nr:hypothetical protein [Lachnospiraceae bacterium]